MTPVKFLAKAFELKEQGNLYFKKKDYKNAIKKYRRIELWTRALTSGPQLPELQIAKTEEEVKKDEEKRKKLIEEGKASGDPKDPRLGDANTPKSMEELEEMTKWMEIPNLWRDLQKSKTPIKQISVSQKKYSPPRSSTCQFVSII